MAVILEIQGLDQLQKDVEAGARYLGQAVKAAMTDSVHTVLTKARDLAPYKTGTLRRSIYSDVQNSGFTGMVAQDINIASYGPMLEFGTKSHDIYPVSKKALFWKGALHPVRHVFHPGFAPRPFMLPALQQSEDQITQFFSDAIAKVVQMMAGK